MINLVRIMPDRQLLISSKTIGTIGENNAEIFKFIFPEKINDEDIDVFECRLVFNSELFGEPASYVYTLEGDTFEINESLTASNELILAVQFLKDSEVKWISLPLTLYVAQTANENSEDPLLKYKEEWELEVKENLADALTESALASELSPVPDYNDMSLNNMINTVENTLIYTDEKRQLVEDYSMLSSVFEKVTQMPLFLRNDSGIAVPYSVPYLNTKSMIYSNYRISDYLIDFGLDLTSAPSRALKWINGNMFNTNNRLKHAKFTHVGKNAWNIDGLQYLESIELYGFNVNHDAGGFDYEPGIRNCPLLNSVNFENGICREELDYTGVSDDRGGFFRNLPSLKNIRFKKSTIQFNLIVSESSSLTRESCLSIINGLNEDVTGRTVAFNAVLKTNSFPSWKCRSFIGDDGKTYIVDDEDGDMTYGEAVTICKGWRLQ